jgi:Xaa-Pro aminopeptidase
MDFPERLAELRKKMSLYGIDLYYIGSADAHQSEYVAEHFRARAWLSGFTGSSGQLAVTPDEAGLWTDGRYFLQAEEALQRAGAGIALFKSGVEGVPEIRQWMAEKLPLNGRLGFDGRTLSADEFDMFKKDFGSKNIAYVYDRDLAGEIWADRPAMPNAPAFEHLPPFAGAPRPEKLAAVRAAMRKNNADYYFAAALDDIAWLLNIRGRDIKHTPVAYAYCLIGLTDAFVFIDPAKLNGGLTESLAADGYTLRGYGEARKFLHDGLPERCRLLYNDKRVSVRLAEAVPDGVTVLREADIIAELKAVKNAAETENIKNAHLKDGAAMVRLLKFIDEWAADPRQPLTEAGVADTVASLRGAQPDFLEPSFETIAAYGANAASMHYAPEGAGDAIEPRGFLLVDSGGQYLDGTTDITRTMVLGDITDEMKRDFTLVLKGHIALARAVFLQGTVGTALDILARMPLWAHGINYRSGTGHGIGYCLGVHEGPHNISMRASTVKLTAGMLVTNEPGVYKENEYGIRTENVMRVTELYKNEQGTFLGFETISFCPIDRRAIDKALLTPEETAWLNDYHRAVFEKLTPYLNAGEIDWLARAAEAL